MAVLHLPKAQIKFKNFEGRETRYTPAGSRSFAIFFDDAGLADVPIGEWNVKFTKPIIDVHGKPLQLAYILVKVYFEEFEGQDCTPKVWLTLTNEDRTETRELDENTIKILDWAPYRYCDVTIHSNPWALGGRAGVMAILDEFHATV